MTERYDVVVVGARCAGAATAMLLARAGLHVLVVDRGRYGVDTLSTHALMRGGVLQLHRWGLLPEIVAAGTPRVAAATFHYGDEAVRVPIKPRDAVGALYAPRRTVLDRILVDAAVAAGVRIEYGARVVGLEQSAARVTGIVVACGAGVRSIAADLVVGADGMRSTIARSVGAEAYRIGHHASAVIYGYWTGLDDGDGYHWYQRPGVTAGQIPTNDGESCVFASCSAQTFGAATSGGIDAGYLRLLAAAAPDLADRLTRARRRRHLFAFRGQRGFFRRSSGTGWALVGDAGYFKDPITAHGITDALRDAELLSRAVLVGDSRAFRDYEQARDALSSELFDITDAIASFEWDAEGIRTLHESLARAMTLEAQALAAEPAAALSA